MRFAINTPNGGPYTSPRLMADLAHEAEESGWDAFFVWDHIGAGWDVPLADPWILLAAMAMTTSRIKLGPIVTPIPRRRPSKLARETVTLDHLSEGRLIFGAGIGGDSGREYSCFGESPDDRLHGEMLDEGLEVLIKLWSGETVSHDGSHYKLLDALFLPRPVQQPRIPIWLAGLWPNKKPFRRAAQWDGIVPIGRDGDMTPDDFRAMIAYIMEHRTGDGPFDVVASGDLTGTDKQKDIDIVAPFAEAGVTWWQQGFDWKHTIDHVREHIRLGPPQL